MLYAKCFTLNGNQFSISHILLPSKYKYIKGIKQKLLQILNRFHFLSLGCMLSLPHLSPLWKHSPRAYKFITLFPEEPPKNIAYLTKTLLKRCYFWLTKNSLLISMLSKSHGFHYISSKHELPVSKITKIQRLQLQRLW